MAIDKAVDSAVLDANLTSIADAIRAKAGTSDKLAFPAGFAEAIAGITVGGGGEGGYDFSELPTPFTHALSGSFILDADTSWNNHYIKIPNSINMTGEKPVMVLIFSNDTEIVYSSTVQTAQVILAYDEGPTLGDKYRQKVGLYACTTTTGSYSSGVYGSFARAGSYLVDYGYKNDNTIKMYVYTSGIEIKAGLNVPTAYYLAGKKYYWLLLGCEV